MTVINKAKSVRPRLKRLELDEALIALFIGRWTRTTMWHGRNWPVRIT
jgi:hypothetical protein